MNVSDLSKIKELRYITVEHLPGHMNIAIDEALSLCLGEKRDYVYLRLYCWRPSCLTFGYNQRISTILNFEEADSAGIDYVRRISGGKMVYHNDEYTFSLGFPVEFLKYRLGAATFIEMFKYAVGPLVKALCKSGVPARFSSPHERLPIRETKYIVTQQRRGIQFLLMIASLSGRQVFSKTNV